MRMGRFYALSCVFLPPFILPPVAQSGETGVYGSFLGGGVGDQGKAVVWRGRREGKKEWNVAYVVIRKTKAAWGFTPEKENPCIVKRWRGPLERCHARNDACLCDALWRREIELSSPTVITVPPQSREKLGKAPLGMQRGERSATEGLPEDGRLISM